MSILYWVLKFSQEALVIELFLISCLSVIYLGYLLLKKRRYGVAKNNIPDQVVRAFLIEMLSNAEGFKNQLFGENLKVGAAKPVVSSEPQVASAVAVPSATAPSADHSAELAQLKKDLQSATATVGKLSSEKTALEQKLGATSGAGGASSAALQETQEKVTKLQALLAEYEVIEDDLANLKKYQQENKTLKEKLAALTGGAPLPAEAEPVVAPPAPPQATAEPVPEPKPAAPVAEPPAAAAPPPAEPEPAPPAPAAPEPTPEPAPAAAGPDAPAGASAFDAAMSAAPAEPAPAASATPASAAPAAPAAGKDTKSDADLLQEFEKMLNG